MKNTFYIKQIFKNMLIGLITIIAVMLFWFLLGIFDRMSFPNLMVTFSLLFSVVTINSVIACFLPITISMGNTRKSFIKAENISSVILTLTLSIITALFMIWGKSFSANLFIIYVFLFLALTGLGEFLSAMVLTSSQGKFVFTLCNIGIGLICGLLGVYLGLTNSIVSEKTDLFMIISNFSPSTVMIISGILILTKGIFNLIFQTRIKRYEYR